MDLNEYQTRAATTAIYPNYAEVLYPLLGLCGEVSELVAKVHAGLWPYTHPIPDSELPCHEALTAMIGAGRRCELLKKAIRGGSYQITEGGKQALKADVIDLVEDREWVDSVAGEAADCNWYLAALLTDLKATLDFALTGNLNKLQKRKEAGVIHGHGTDSREDREPGK